MPIVMKWVPHCGYPGEGPFGIITANATAWSSSLKWLDESDDAFELICIQEHHLSTKTGIDIARANALSKGYQCCLNPALDTGNSGGTTGGVGFIWPHYIRISCPGEIIACHWAMSVQVENHSLGQLIVVSFYGHPKDIAITHKRLDDLMSKLCATGFSFIIAGDFNIHSDEMASWLGEHHPRTQIREGGDTCFTTAGSSTIDYFLFHGPVCDMKASVQTLDTGLATHRPVEVSFDSWTNQEVVKWMPRQQLSLIHI